MPFGIADSLVIANPICVLGYLTFIRYGFSLSTLRRITRLSVPGSIMLVSIAFKISYSMAVCGNHRLQPL
ncbi:hypothetical protein BDV33DRAFT_176374 [Aspergillus novoparasiticus]|uniref:Uncharacterized protein n=1 Tax=Aspergillus novoparasiticus TaxID=986946 RepID=A0A5N6EJX1_9EURO|nr:hypothetical protein BDV33DRAFT_176374 [Aspergillus novoparasiticus]